MTGTYRGRSRHRLPRREGARSAGRTGGAPQYVPADMYPPGTEIPQKRSRWHVPPSTWHGNPAKAFQVACPAFHLARKSRESVSGSTSCLPPGTEIPRKRSRCHFLPSTCHGIPVKVFQVSPSAVHLPRFSRESVPGVLFRLPPGTEIPRKRVRCLSPPSTCHGIPAKACQVAPLAFHLLRQFLSSWDVGTFQQGKLVVFSKKRATIGTPEVGECVHLSENHDVSIPPSTCHGFPAKVCQVSPSAVHLARYSRKSVPGVLLCFLPATESLRKCSRCLFPPSTCHGIPAKVFQVSLPAVHLPRNPCKSVPGVLSCLPPATEFPQKRSRCHLLPPTCYGFPAKVCQVSPSAVHLARYPRKSVPGVLFRLPPGTESPQKRVRCPFPAAHLARKSRKSVPGGMSRLPPGTVSLRKRVR